MKPNEIEQESFRIIESEAGDHGFPPDQWVIVRRMIHATADFDYLSSVRFHPLKEIKEHGLRAPWNWQPI